MGFLAPMNKFNQSLPEIVYIRHAPKKHKNGDVHAEFLFDPPIVGNPLNQVRSVVESIYKSEHPPDHILCSPFRRTRQTAQLIQSILENEYGLEIDIYLDPRIGEFLGNHVGKVQDCHLDPETLKHDPILDKNFYTFQSRVQKHYEDLYERYNSKEENKTIWVVTHSLVMREVIGSLGKKIRTISDLGVVRITEKNPWILRGDRWILNSNSKFVKPEVV